MKELKAPAIPPDKNLENILKVEYSLCVLSIIKESICLYIPSLNPQFHVVYGIETGKNNL